MPIARESKAAGRAARWWISVRRRAIILTTGWLVVAGAATTPRPAFMRVRAPARILLVTLDDRPSSLQWPVRLGAVADVEVVAPPRELLGNFSVPGRPDAIFAWVRAQDLSAFDAAVVSIDMLAYGGLVASRTDHSATDSAALGRLAFVGELRRRAPHLKIYGASVLTRLAPTADGSNETWRVALARWAEISAVTGDSALATETKRLESAIPVSLRATYGAVRRRNATINRAALQLVRDGVLDYLIVSQDDARARGLHVAEREHLRAIVDSAGIRNAVTLQPGTDEAAMLLLARAVAQRVGRRPSVAVSYSSERMADQPMPFEDQPLRRTVSLQIAAAGAVETRDGSASDLRLFVFTSRNEQQRATVFADSIQLTVARGARVVVADVDPKGDVQGADSVFAEALTSRRIVARLAGYAAWNTAGNAIGTALAHAVLSEMAATPVKGGARIAPSRAATQAHRWFLADRWLDDFVWHTLVRPGAARLVRDRGWNALQLTEPEARVVADYAAPLMRAGALRLRMAFGVVDTAGQPCAGLRDFRFTLPWRRTFEAEFEFALADRCADN